MLRYPHLVWERAKPGLIGVNGAAKRFVNESTSYHEFGLAMHESHRSVPSIPAFLICDADFLRRWGLGLALPGGRPFRKLVKAGYLVEGRTLDDLARQLGLDGTVLAETVAAFNRGAREGRDAAFGKGGDAYNRYLGDPTVKDGNPCLGTVETAPFYAVRVYPGDIGTAGGIVTDENARVLDRDGAPIPGLYAAGNDMNSVMGGTIRGPASRWDLPSPSAGSPAATWPGREVGSVIRFRVGQWFLGPNSDVTALSNTAARASSFTADIQSSRADGPHGVGSGI